MCVLCGPTLAVSEVDREAANGLHGDPGVVTGEQDLFQLDCQALEGLLAQVGHQLLLWGAQWIEGAGQGVWLTGRIWRAWKVVSR